MQRRILLVINSLEGGGAENVMARLAGQLAARLEGDEISLALLDDLPAAYPLPAGMTVHQLDCRGALWRSVRGVAALIRTWQPDVVLSFLTRANCAAILARGQGDYRCVISERVNTTSHLGSGGRARLRRGLVAGLYPRADAVIAVSAGVRDELVARYRVDPARVAVIGNPVAASDLLVQGQQAPGLALPPDYFVSVGRLVPNKGADVLLRAFAAHCNRDRHLVILGEGPDRARLGALAGRLGLSRRLHMPGHVANPHAIVQRATAYVSASRSEGFPNALVEAMALGRPVVMTDCPSGPAEILAEGQTGQVTCATVARWGGLVPVDDVSALTEALDRLDDPTVRHALGQRAGIRARAYSQVAVAEDYIRVLAAGSGGDF